MSMQFEGKIVAMLDSCIICKRGSTKANRKRMWTAYHTMRVSKHYYMTWKELLQLAGVSDYTPAFYQYVGNEMFKDIIRN